MPLAAVATSTSLSFVSTVEKIIHVNAKVCVFWLWEFVRVADCWNWNSLEDCAVSSVWWSWGCGCCLHTPSLTSRLWRSAAPRMRRENRPGLSNTACAPAGPACLSTHLCRTKALHLGYGTSTWPVSFIPTRRQDAVLRARLSALPLSRPLLLGPVENWWQLHCK